jgi:outer membrane scaffolding protein for murein synthesis (MipA/OmpV family)
MTLERDPKFIGWQFTPRLNLDVANPFGHNGWTLAVVGGPVFGSHEQHDYFYGVAPQYATASRAEYDAKAGYAGMQVLSALWKRFPSFWMGGFLRFDDVRGAVFENSPLVTQKSGFSGGVAMTWVLGQSSKMVAID